MEIICTLLTVFLVALFARAILSWFPIRPGSPWATVSGILLDLTEWALRPVRRVVPATGMIDISFLILSFGVLLLRQAICH